MKLLYQLLVSEALLLTSCKQTNTTDRPADAPISTPSSTSAAPSDTSTTRSPTKASIASSPVADTLHLISDKLVEQSFKTLDYKKSWPELKHAAKKFELTPGMDDPAVTDSIITYRTSSNSFVYIKSGIVGAGADLNAGIIRCQITAPPTHLPKSISLGMSQAALARVLGVKPFTADVVLVTEQEGYQRFYFVFKDGFLRAVNFESYYMG